MVQNIIGKKVSEFFNSTKDPITTVAKDVLYLRIPFLSGCLNGDLRKEILKLVNRFYPQVDLRIRFRNDFTVSSFFNHKDRIGTYSVAKLCSVRIQL